MVRVPTGVLETGNCVKKVQKVEKEYLKYVISLNDKFEVKKGNYGLKEKEGWGNCIHRRSASEIKTVHRSIDQKFVERVLGNGRNMSFRKRFRQNSVVYGNGSLCVGKPGFVRSKLLPLFLQNKSSM